MKATRVKTEQNGLIKLSSSDVKNSSRTKSQVIEFKSNQKRLVAYKNATSKECKVQFFDQDSLNLLNLKSKLRTKTPLSENEVAKIVGQSVIDFCGNNAIVFADNRETIARSKRSIDRKRYRGQTQTQFVSFGPNNFNGKDDAKNGVAEALSQPELSRATVSGTNGMGQAQSQSSVSDCEECYGQSVRGSHGGYSQENPAPQTLQIASMDGQHSKPLPGTNRQGGNTQFPPSGEQYPGGKLNADQPTRTDPYYTNEKHPSSPVGHSGVNPNSGIGLQANTQIPSGQSGPAAFPSNEPIDRSSGTSNQRLGLNAFPSNGQIPYEQRPGAINPSGVYSNPRNPYDNSQQVGRNTYPSSANSPGFTYPVNVVPNTQQASFPSGSGFPGFPSGSSHGIIAPHVSTMENVNFKYPHNSYQQNIPNGNTVDQPQYQPWSNQQTGQPFIGDGSYPPQNPPSKITYPSFLNSMVGQNTNQYSFLPSLCSFVYQTCLNALANIKESNGYFTPNNYPHTSSYTGLGKYSGTSDHRNLAAPNRSPQGTLDGETAGTPQFGFAQPRNNALSPDLSGNVGSGGQQPNFMQTAFNPNLGQTGGINIPYPSSIGNSGYGNQPPIYNGPSQNSIGTVGSGVQQPGTGLNPNSWQGGTNVRYPSSGSSVQQPNFQQPGSGLNPNLGPIGTNVQYPNSYGNIGTQEPGANALYPNSFGNFATGNQQPNYNVPSSNSTGNAGPGIQQPGNGLNPNLGQPGANIPYPGSFGSFGTGNQQPESELNPNLRQPGTNVNYPSSYGNFATGNQQPNYNVPSSSSTGNAGPGIQQPGSGLNPNLGQLGTNIPYPGSFGSFGTDNQQPNYNGPPSGATGNVGPGIQQPGSLLNTNLGQPGANAPYPSSYGNRQPYYSGPGSPGNFGTAGQQPNQRQPTSSGSFPSSVNVNPGDSVLSVGQQQYGAGTQKEPTGSHPPQNGGADVSSGGGGQVTSVDAEGGEAQSLTSVNVDGIETSAAASSQGKSKSGGMTQTQVSGTYSGTGTFSAQAQTSDSDKGAQSNIASNANGTTSAAQGRAGKGRAQSQIHYDLESGVALGEAQSVGADYATNTQLQAGIKGGIADAQSSGAGGTSSQAQIGFLPHDSDGTEQKSLFKGGGTASAQGGARKGQSQSQLSGSYRYGISYNGAAQASSGDKVQGLPKLTVDGAKAKIDRLAGTTVRNEIAATSTPPTPAAPLPEVDDDTEEYDEEYEEDDDEKEAKVGTTSAPTPAQTQNVFLNLEDEQQAHVVRDSDDQQEAGQVLDAGQLIPGTDGTRVPNGLRARVASAAGDRTEAKATPGGQAQTQTVLLTPGGGGLTVVDKSKLRAMTAKESYVAAKGFHTDLNGETGRKYRPVDDNVQYFTKSSTCGYFSFSCNYIDGAKAGAKICKPNPPPLPCKRN
ncbi:collagen alpha-1(I) chain-like isoform X2 [Adelges cooleyi]|uniref:collagen alpha-1(I) chain-like isoform X2 n=1 Tax=Adelges cooleyi TaxID=133065 RepID=UPI00217FD491|nr:collagen alpha-1(I) chain-like isoform X2 [Adelges cooleyi]